MIDEIRIQDIGVIAGADIPLGPGLTAITGETGAGKTMLLTGLGLLLGGRAEPAAVRTGAHRATVEGCFAVDPVSPLADRVREAGGEVDPDGSLIVVRTVPAQGRSRAFLGGRGVPQALLAEIADELVTVHGQADQMRLRAPAKQREALDAYGGPDHLALVARYREVWAERRTLVTELDTLVHSAQERARELEMVRAGLEELERVGPVTGEDAALAAEAERLGNAEDLRAAAAAAHTALAGEEDTAAGAPGAVTGVEHARRVLEQVAPHDGVLGRLASRVADVGYTLTDLTAELVTYVQDLQADPARLETVQQRRAELGALARTLGVSVEDLSAWGEDAVARVLHLEGSDERVEAVRTRLDEIEATLTGLADTLSSGRSSAAVRLADAVTAELSGLAMAGASLVVEVEPAEPGPHGADDVRMLLVPHAGAPPRPLGHGASGGELSRVMLALEVVLATAPGGHRPATFVFDEVDAGVGGKAAVEVGRRLAKLAQQTQVVVVTHLAQVAAFADRQVVVTKSRSEGHDVVTASDVRHVDGDARVAELARMLSGQEDSTAALEHAAELLERSTVAR